MSIASQPNQEGHIPRIRRLQAPKEPPSEPQLEDATVDTTGNCECPPGVSPIPPDTPASQQSSDLHATTPRPGGLCLHTRGGNEVGDPEAGEEVGLATHALQSGLGQNGEPTMNLGGTSEHVPHESANNERLEGDNQSDEVRRQSAAWTQFEKVSSMPPTRAAQTLMHMDPRDRQRCFHLM